MKNFILLFLVLITNAALGQTTLWCEGYAWAKDAREKRYVIKFGDKSCNMIQILK
jgi:hypothetical protein